MVVNEAFVEWFFPGRNPVGRTLTMTLEVPDGEFTFDPKAIVGIDQIRRPQIPPVLRRKGEERQQGVLVIHQARRRLRIELDNEGADGRLGVALGRRIHVESTTGAVVVGAGGSCCRRLSPVPVPHSSP